MESHFWRHFQTLASLLEKEIQCCTVSFEGRYLQGILSCDITLVGLLLGSMPAKENVDFERYVGSKRKLLGTVSKTGLDGN